MKIVECLASCLLLNILRVKANSSSIPGEIFENSLKWNLKLPSDEENTLIEKGSSFEQVNRMNPDIHWNPLDNGHKKKQFPRASKRQTEEFYPRRRENINGHGVYKSHSKRSKMELDHPTLRPFRHFHVHNDVEILHTAMRKHILNDDEIIDIMTKRTDDQRKEIIRLYPNLKNEFGMKLSFGFRELMRALSMPLQEFRAEQVKEALGFSTKPDESRLIELLCTLNNHQVRAIQQAYFDLYRKEIREELQAFSHHPIISFLISYIRGNRDERYSDDLALAMNDAQQIKNAEKLDVVDGSPFHKILTSRSFSQLKLTFNEYKRLTGMSIKEIIRKQFSGKVQKNLLSIVKTILNRPQYFAEILNSGIRNFSKRDSTLIRVIILRSEIDLEDIKNSYEKLYNIPLTASIPTNSGSLKKALISLLTG